MNRVYGDVTICTQCGLPWNKRHERVNIVSLAHILYMSDNVRICESPERLGSDFVINQRATSDPLSSCKECYSLLFAYNEREFEADTEERLMDDHNKRRIFSPSEMKATKGLTILFVVSAVMWLAMFGLVVFR